MMQPPVLYPFLRSFEFYLNMHGHQPHSSKPASGLVALCVWDTPWLGVQTEMASLSIFFYNPKTTRWISSSFGFVDVRWRARFAQKEQETLHSTVDVLL
jgi:hypothetical protein